MPSPLALAVDFGGTKVAAALVDASGRVLDPSRARASTGRSATTHDLERNVAAVVEHALDALPPHAQLVGAGIGSAGPVDRQTGYVSPLNVPAWRNYPLRDLVEAILTRRDHETPVTLELDGAAITLAEHWIGAGVGVRTMMGMVVSTGVGGGLLLNGALMPGVTGNAGHIGHVDVAGITGEETFGSATSLEAIASGPHSVAWARRHGFAGTTGEELVAAAVAGDELAIRAIRRSGTAVGRAIASATALLELELVAIGGGFAEASTLLIEAAREVVAQHHLEYVRRVRIVPSALSGDGPLIGAAALVHCAQLVTR